MVTHRLKYKHMLHFTFPSTSFTLSFIWHFDLSKYSRNLELNILESNRLEINKNVWRNLQLKALRAVFLFEWFRARSKFTVQCIQCGAYVPPARGSCDTMYEPDTKKKRVHCLHARNNHQCHTKCWLASTDCTKDGTPGPMPITTTTA